MGVMKGVIWSVCPDAQIADVSHMIGAQNVFEAALILARSAPYFPPGTIQLLVVDPGVGTARRPMAARLGSSYYVGPDNGAITLWLERARAESWPIEFVQLDRPAYWLPDVSHVFHGRDIFAPIAAHLARGVPLGDLGSHFSDPVELELPRPRRLRRGWEGEVVHVDHFGNIASNITAQHLGEALEDKGRLEVRVGGYEIHGLVDTFGERKENEVVALLGSTGNLIVAVVNGNAADSLGVGIGDALNVEIPSKQEFPGQGARG